MPKNPAPDRPQSVFPTPNLEDVIFWEWRDDVLGANEIPEKYGEKHRNGVKYPHHILVFISDVDTETQKRRWYYAAKREEQWRYNKEISYPYNGRKRFPRITRTTVELRDEYEAALTTTPPAVAASTADNEYTSATLVAEVQQQIPDERLRSKFVAVVRTYDTIPDITDADDLAELKKFGYRVSFPFGDENYPRVTWTFPIELNKYSEAGVSAACPIDASGTGGTDYTGLKLSDEQLSPVNEESNKGVVTRVYDTLPGPTLDTVSKRIPHGIPEKYIVSATLTREETRKETGATPTTPSGDPVDSESVIESVVGPESQSHYLDRQIDTKWSVSVDSCVDKQVDMDTGGIITITSEVVDKPGSASAVDANGEYTEVRSLSQTKSLEVSGKTTDLAGNTQTWETIERVYWPPVLESVFFAPIDAYLKFNGVSTGETYTKGIYSDYEVKEGGVFETRVVYERTWSSTAPAADTAVTLIPRPIAFQFVRFGARIPATLHPAILFQEQIGNNDPDYPPQILSKTFDATNYTDWPASRIIRSQVRPGRGGFFKLKATAYAPS